LQRSNVQANLLCDPFLSWIQVIQANQNFRPIHDCSSRIFRLKIECVPASRDEAPVVICAPHTSFLDVFVIAICRGSPVARIENSKTPGMSAIQTVGHTIFVDRRSDQSRHAALQTILSRVTSSLSWPQVVCLLDAKSLETDI